MTTLSSLQKSVNEWIEKHGPDHEIACFLFHQDEIQEAHLHQEEIAVAEAGDQWEILPLSDEELTAVVHHMESSSSYARLYGQMLQAISHVNALNESA